MSYILGANPVSLESVITSHLEISKYYHNVRNRTRFLCDPLEIEDFVVQPIVDVSPLKWHLGHTTWFFETFVLVPYLPGYQLFNEKYPYLFNSYYISAGDRWARANRGQLTRPTVKEIFEYRAFVNKAMNDLFEKIYLTEEIIRRIEMGCHHEQQHQELFLYDIKRILGDNPLFPEYKKISRVIHSGNRKSGWLNVEEGIYEIGCEGAGFYFDNESGFHKVFLHEYEIEADLVTNREYLDFIESGGYSNHVLWLSEAWDWLNQNEIKAPRYWYQEDGKEWKNYTLGGFEPINWVDPVAHISYYEADAFARWKGYRLPTEYEWEVACGKFSKEIPQNANFLESNFFRPIQTGTYDFFGNLWEWTSSPYTAYPFFKMADGTLGEYNGKFMVNQIVLRGGSFATSKSHIRRTYRNFFHPHLRWLFSGIRLARHK
ncbi:MAG: ergothioneine biosynthesis protein EgtB [Ekhidna sp.]|nr:ergothioneine biosynthesis protein EgtB [Ekhidna sp.]